jgi:hypothetical protein
MPASPVVQNGSLLTMTRAAPPTSVQRAFTIVRLGIRNGRSLPLITTVGLLGGQPFTVLNPLVGQSVKTKVDGMPVVLNGALVQSPDGYQGTVTLPQTAGPTLIVG